MFELKVTMHFAAAHQLKMVGEKCENLHGHNWKVEAYVSGAELNTAGILMDFGEIKTALKEIINRLDHQYLNDLEPFSRTSSSSENIAMYIATELQQKVDQGGVKVSRVRVWESENAAATFMA